MPEPCPHCGEAHADLGYLQRRARQKPKRADIRAELGRALLEHERPAEAAEEFRAAARLQPNNLEWQFHLGRALALANRSEEGLPLLQEILRQAPNNAALNGIIGITLRDIDRPEEAIPYIQAAVRLAEHEDEVYEWQLELAHTLLRADRFDEAVQLGRELGDDQDDEVADVYHCLAINLEADHEPELAARLYREALRLDPENAELRVGLAKVLLATEEYDEAIAIRRELAREEPENPEEHALLGEALLAADRPAEAVEAYRRAAELDPDALDYRVDLGQGYVAAGRYQEAIEHLERLLADEPEEAAAVLHLGRALAKLGRVEEARAKLHSLIEADLDGEIIGGAHTELASLALKEGRRDTVIEHLQAAVERSPRSLPHLLALAIQLATAGRLEEARAALQPLLELAEEEEREGLIAHLETLAAGAGESDPGPEPA